MAVHDVLNDSRSDQLDLNEQLNTTKEYAIKEIFANYIKFEILSFYGDGGGLQYFATSSGKINKLTNIYIRKSYS